MAILACQNGVPRLAVKHLIPWKGGIFHYGKDDLTGQGFRAAASALLNECGKWNADAIEAQLAQVESNKSRKACARAE
jgi:hypothetical protein